MAGVFDLFKKKHKDEPSESDKAEKDHTVTKTTTEETTTSGSQAYSGIGNPPSGKAYSGIGSPPGGGKPYSGIGNPPSISTTSTTTTADTSKHDVGSTSDTSLHKQDDQSKKDQKPDANQQLTSKIDQKKRGELDLMTHLTPRSNRVFVAAQNKARELKSEFVDSEHLLHGLLGDPEIYKLLTEAKAPPQMVEQELEKIYKKGKSDKQPQPSPRVKRVLDNSLVVARKLGFDFISPEHILLSLFKEGEGAGARVLAKLGLKEEDLNKKIVGKKEGLETEKGTETSKGALEQYAIDLTAKATQGLLDPVVERSDVIERVIHILSRRTKNNPALIGEAGVGKTAIAEGLAQKIVKKEVPEPLLTKRVLQLDLMSIIAGASHRGDFEKRMKQLIEEVTGSKGQIILFIDEIHNIVGAGAGGEGALDASNFLKPSLARGELQVIGATTITEYRKYIEKDPALERRFQPVMVSEPNEEQAIKMVKALRDKYEAFHRVKIPDEAIELAVRLSKRYVGDRFLPDKAVDLVDEAGSAVRLPLISLPEEIRSLEERISQLNQELQEVEKSGNRVRVNILKPKVNDLQAQLSEKKEEFETKKGQTTNVVSEQLIKDIVSRWTGVPVSKISASEVEKLTKLEDIMHKRLINQDSAVSSVSQAVRRGRAGLKSAKRPIGSFVFLGPTGVGKTELAKTLAEILFGQEEAIVRLDMTEFMEKHEVAKLLGAPPGYVGYEEGGKLTEAVRRKPYSVVLFDEIEKAHPDIFNILLQILDDGRLTDNKGHVISFKNSVVICTSNIGTSLIQEDILKTGKMEVEEPPVLSTYTFSPRGREILTIMGKAFEREPGDASAWKSKMLLDYFSGQKIEGEDEKQDEVQFPATGFDTHAISPKGVEMVTRGDTLFFRTSTTTKVWKIMNLIDYYKDNIVVNALPDAPDQQLPSSKLKTHAFSPDETEFITFKDRYWKRKGNATDWETGLLRDYFKGQTIAGAPSVAQTNGDTTGQMKAPNGQHTPSDVAKAENQSSIVDKPTKESDSHVRFPVNYWDIHIFSPQGQELIVVGNQVWTRQTGQSSWQMKTLQDYFGSDFPLEKELDEKSKIEAEIDKNQYQVTKGKVMAELRKFFRPELINRFDEVIIFEPLRYEHMLQIVELQMKGLKKLMEEQNMGFSWTKAAAKEIVRAGFDPIYGARPLRRTIQRLIENPISTLIIEQKVKEGDMVVVDFDGESFIFNIEKVELVPEDKLSQKGKKKFFCEKCGNNFESEKTPNSTTVCSECASDDVQEVVSQKEETLGKETAPPQKPQTPEPESTPNPPPPGKSGELKNPQESDGNLTAKKFANI